MTTDLQTVQVEVRGPMRELFRTTDSCLISAAAGTGKTFQTLFWLHMMMLKYPGTKALVVRKTAKSLTGTTLATLREKVAREAMEQQLVRFYGGSSAEPPAFRYKNGSRILIGGLDDPQRIMGAEVSIIVIDEAIETIPRDIDMLRTRLRGAGPTAYPHYRMVLLTNPGPPSHHLRTTEGLRVAYSTHRDNPALWDRERQEWTSEGDRYLAELRSLTGVQRARLLEGKWVAAEGVIWSEFDEAVHVIPRFDIPEHWTRWWAVDFGYVHPFAAQWWAEDPDGRLYLYREILMTKRLVEDHAAQMIAAVTDSDGAWTEPKPRAILTDHAAEDRATLEKHLGLKTKPAKKTVTDGLQAVSSRLRVADDGKPRLYLMSGSLLEVDSELEEAGHPTSLAAEIPGYVWADHKTKEVPVKEHDDASDALRYIVAHRDLRKTGYNVRTL
jgi:phage terminase large subunit